MADVYDIQGMGMLGVDGVWSFVVKFLLLFIVYDVMTQQTSTSHSLTEFQALNIVNNMCSDNS